MFTSLLVERERVGARGVEWRGVNEGLVVRGCGVCEIGVNGIQIFFRPSFHVTTG
jgi:hypothetical protein